MKNKTRLVSVIAACAAIVTSAYASVTFNPATGTGFVGKGDVQTVLGLNNAQLQAQAASLAFSYVTVNTYEVVNAWATGNPDNPVSLSSHTETVTTFVGVNSSVAYATRKNSQGDVTGINLTGFGDIVINGVIPVVSNTVTYVLFNWYTQEWDGTYDTVANPNYNGHNSPTIQVKHYITVTHTSDQLPVDENGNLYTQGNNKAVVSVTLIDSVGGLLVNGVPLPITL